MLVPQGMAYALIAGLPPIYGLYASLVPLLVYALLGTSRQLAVGPVAMVSLLVAAGVAPLAAGDPERAIALALLLALMVGVLQLGLGLLRFGFLTNFLSHPVLAGFTSAAALVIGATQLRHLVGVDLVGGERVHDILLSLAARLGQVHLLTLGIGLGAIVVLIALRKLSRTFPGALLVVGIATAAAAIFDLGERGLRLVGEIPRGLPTPVLPPLDPEAFAALLPAALTISLVGFMESIAVAKAYATKNRHEVNPNRELIALGTANLVGAFFRAYPTTGGFARTAVNDQAGARTTVATMVAATVVALTLMLFTGLLRTLPNAVLAAIVMVAVSSLVNWKEAIHLWRVDRRDFGMMLLTFAATLVVGIEEGILVGVFATLAALLYDTSRPHAAFLGRLPGTNSYRNLSRYSEAEPVPGVTIYRMDATLCFANVEFLRESVRGIAEADPRPRAIVFDFHAVNGADSTGLHLLAELRGYLEGLGVGMYFAGVKGPVMDRFRRAGLRDEVGEDRFFLEVGQAVEAARA